MTPILTASHLTRRFGDFTAVDDVSFAGRVTRISDKAEFTPRNVQTVQGRKNTVYAVRLALDNADLTLKPGMPADVRLGK